jgi:hypothetical protein
MLREPTDHWKVAADTTHVFLLAAMLSFGIVALIFYFRVTAKLESIGESTPGLVIEPKDVFETFRKYRTGRSEFVARVVAASVLDCSFVRGNFRNGIRLLALGPFDSSPKVTRRTRS